MLKLKCSNVQTKYKQIQTDIQTKTNKYIRIIPPNQKRGRRASEIELIEHHELGVFDIFFIHIDH